MSGSRDGSIKLFVGIIVLCIRGGDVVVYINRGGRLSGSECINMIVFVMLMILCLIDRSICSNCGDIGCGISSCSSECNVYKYNITHYLIYWKLLLK